MRWSHFERACLTEGRSVRAVEHDAVDVRPTRTLRVSGIGPYRVRSLVSHEQAKPGRGALEGRQPSLGTDAAETSIHFRRHHLALPFALVYEAYDPTVGDGRDGQIAHGSAVVRQHSLGSLLAVGSQQR